MAVLYRSDPTRGEVYARVFAQSLPAMPFHIGSAPDPAAVEYMITWTPPADLSAYPNLRLIFSVGAGVDQFDMSALPPQVGVVRMMEPGIAQQMAQMAAMAVLSLHRDMPAYLSQARQGRWQALTTRDAGRTRVGVMGLGQLGRAVLAGLAPFGFDLAGYNRSPRDIAGVDCTTDLAAFLAGSDIVVCLLPLTDETRGILNDAFFAALPDGAHLVHLGRGAQLDVAALGRALEGRLASAWLDVTDPEPLPQDHWLWSHPRVIVTPHVASQTDAAQGAAHVVAGIRADRAGQDAPGLVDRDRGY
ncbi:2-hydroxyacid dehydrogenase [Paracoccus indicus]|uniref:2-hydroxyacid dehydrogenase n=1 Tax=Paracoccus indicus TaxID=2079229 RepID=UPI000D353A66|nr:glyoxylate/hydroxypyruvate reductase A [Paracoccus indicus]